MNERIVATNVPCPVCPACEYEPCEKGDGTETKTHVQRYMKAARAS